MMQWSPRYTDRPRELERFECCGSFFQKLVALGEMPPPHKPFGGKPSRWEEAEQVAIATAMAAAWPAEARRELVRQMVANRTALRPRHPDDIRAQLHEQLVLNAVAEPVPRPYYGPKRRYGRGQRPATPAEPVGAEA